jgi:hypothetical protein
MHFLSVPQQVSLGPCVPPEGGLSHQRMPTVLRDRISKAKILTRSQNARLRPLSPVRIPFVDVLSLHLSTLDI